MPAHHRNRTTVTRLFGGCLLAAAAVLLAATAAAAEPKVFRLTELLDRPVRNEEKTEIGEIEDLVLRRIGTVQQAVIAIDGFLGIEGKEIGVSYRKLDVEAPDRIRLDATVEQLDDHAPFSHRQPGLYAGLYYRPLLPDLYGEEQGRYERPYDRFPYDRRREGPAGYRQPMGPRYGPGGPFDYDTRPPRYRHGGWGRWHNNPYSSAFYPAKILASAVLGRVVIDENGREIAEVEDLIVDAGGSVPHILLSIGGFMDVGDKVVAVPWRSLGFTRWAVTYKGLDRQRLEAMEPYRDGS